MDNAEDEGVMADVSSNLLMSSCVFIFSDVDGTWVTLMSTQTPPSTLVGSVQDKCSV